MAPEREPADFWKESAARLVIVSVCVWESGRKSDKDQGELRKVTEVWHGISVEIVFRERVMRKKNDLERVMRKKNDLERYLGREVWTATTKCTPLLSEISFSMHSDEKVADTSSISNSAVPR
jgi:hypothetical protein